MAVVTFRRYCPDDAQQVGCLIADTYSQFNLTFAPPEERALFLGPFQHARSPHEAHQEAIARTIQAAIVFVAVEEKQVVGVLRGKSDQLQSLFVRADHHRQGIGRQLVERFEEECRRQGSAEIRVRATVYAVPFYTAVGYKRTTGIRAMRSFDGTGLEYQPMKKVLRDGSKDRTRAPRAG